MKPDVGGGTRVLPLPERKWRQDTTFPFSETRRMNQWKYSYSLLNNPINKPSKLKTPKNMTPH